MTARHVFLGGMLAAAATCGQPACAPQREKAVPAAAQAEQPRFDSDEALAGMKKGLATRAADIGNCPPELAADSAARIRDWAAIALARSPHPEARPLLLSLWNDPVSGVRQRVLHALGKTKTPQSTARLKRMCDDPDEYIRGQAKVYLVERGAEAAQPAGGAEKSKP